MRKVLYLMGVLSDTDVQWLAANGIRSTLAPGATLVQQGVPIDHLYILLDGRLAVQTGGNHIATLVTGEVVGEISFVDSRPPLASVVVLTPSIVLGIQKTALLQKLESDGLFGARFYRAIALFLADRLRTTTGRLGYSTTNDVEALGDPDGLDDALVKTVSTANVRFDYLLKNSR